MIEKRIVIDRSNQRSPEKEAGLLLKDVETLPRLCLDGDTTFLEPLNNAAVLPDKFTDRTSSTLLSNEQFMHRKSFEKHRLSLD